jgi:glycosyl hydrolase family 10
MGQMLFVIPRSERIVPGAAEQAYLASSDGIPWECRTTLSGEGLVIERETRESGYLYFPWKVADRGLVQICSGALMERPKPYSLPVELARGTLNRVRNQASVWETAGMAIPARFRELLQLATDALALAATSQVQPQTAHDHADEAIRLGLDAGDALCEDYARQVIAIRRNQQPPPTLLMAARLFAAPTGEAATKYLSAFNMVVAGLHWPDIEPQLGDYHWGALDKLVAWTQENNLRLCMGPLVQLDKSSLPDWLFLDDGYEEVQASALKFVSEVVARYRGKVQLWHVASRMNQEGAFAFSEEQRLRLVVEAVDKVRSHDARTPLVVSFNQPWAEYIARKDQELTPYNFADTLVRGELGLAGVGLEIHYGYWPGGTLPRDGLELSRQLDRWTQIGVPLMVLLSAPSSMGADKLARHPSHPLVDLRAGGVNAAWQQQIIQRLLPVLLAKSPVQAIVWQDFQENQPHELACSGLLDAAGHVRPGLQTMIDQKRLLAE